MRLLRFLTLITFLAVTIPDTRSGNSALTMLLHLSMSSPVIPMLLSALSILAIIYTLISLFLQQTPLTRKLNILSHDLSLILQTRHSTNFTRNHISKLVSLISGT